MRPGRHHRQPSRRGSPPPPNLGGRRHGLEFGEQGCRAVDHQTMATGECRKVEAPRGRDDDLGPAPVRRLDELDGRVVGLGRSSLRREPDFVSRVREGVGQLPGAKGRSGHGRSQSIVGEKENTHDQLSGSAVSRGPGLGRPRARITIQGRQANTAAAVGMTRGLVRARVRTARSLAAKEGGERGEDGGRREVAGQGAPAVGQHPPWVAPAETLTGGRTHVARPCARHPRGASSPDGSF